MPSSEIQLLAECSKSLPKYAAGCLRILNKAGEEVPLVLNAAQRHAHALIEKQKAEAGKVRALILKGRQQGLSTYVQARLRHLLRFNSGKKAYVLAHEQAASDNLFKMAKRYQDSDPIAPSVGTSNAKEIWFDGLECRYEVATAGSKEVGRSGTAQFLHASEYAFWPNAANHWAGIGQTVPDLPGTEIIVESTANGVVKEGADFYQRWVEAIRGRGDFIPIFVPWYWQDEYRRRGPFTRTAEEDELAQTYGLVDEQLAWRRAKIENDFKGDDSKFRQEYPSTWAEAFVAEDRDSFIKAGSVVRAQQDSNTVPAGAMLVGVDPARYGGDSTAIVVRQGRKVRSAQQFHGKSTMEVAGIVARFIEASGPDRVFVDVIGIGAGVYDRLVELGYGSKSSGGSGQVVAVNVAERAVADDQYVNRRAECWGLMKQWLDSPPVSLPPTDDWLADLTSVGYTYDSSGRLKLESKEKMRDRGEKSPDLADALSLTFAEPVRKKEYSGPLVEASPAYEDMEAW